MNTAAKRVAVARRLGAPIVSCVSCGVTKRENESFLMIRNTTAVGDPASIGVRVHGCSISCATAYSSLFPRDCLSVFRKLEWGPYLPPGGSDWKPIGSFNSFNSKYRQTLGLWVWTDTGNARWIEENVARLRARGEIS